MSANPPLNEKTDQALKRPLKEDIFEFLHAKIISGEYKPGDWLRQDDIATQLGVSMTPVREALDLLVSAGIAERVPYRGVRVREMITKDIVEAYGMRLVLEAMVAREAAKNITRQQLAGLEGTIDEMKEHDSLKEMSHARRLSREFHSAIARASNNDLLTKMYEIVSNAFPDWLLYEALFRKPELLADSMSATHKEHTAIVNALKQGDTELTAQKSIEHVMESGRWLKDYLDIPGVLLQEQEERVLFLMKTS